MLGGPLFGVEFAEAGEDFGVEDGGPGGSADGVVGEDDELPVEQGAGTEAAYGGGHSVAAHAVEAGLGAVDGVVVLDGLVGGGGEVLALEGVEAGPGFENLVVGGGGAELDGDALGVAVFYGDAVAVGGEAGVEGVDAAAGESAKKLDNFFLELFFFVLDEGDDVAEDVEGGDAGVACAGDGLEGGDEEAFDAEAGLERGEGEDEADGAAVGVGDDVAAGLVFFFAVPGLVVDEGEVVGVDLGHDEGDVGGHAEGGGVGDDGASGGGEAWFEVAGDVGVEGGEDDSGEFAIGSLGEIGLEGHAGDAGGERGVELPAAGFGVGSACRAVAGGEPGDLEPGVIGEELNESLTDHAGRAEYPYIAPFHLDRITRSGGLRRAGCRTSGRGNVAGPGAGSWRAPAR